MARQERAISQVAESEKEKKERWPRGVEFARNFHDEETEVEDPS